MKIFKEKQFIKRWWLFMFILAIILIVVGTAYYTTREAEEDTAVIISVISLVIVIPLVFALAYTRLETRIDEEGISSEFKPFKFTRKLYKWNEIEECYIRKVDARREFGGWGIRGLGSDKKAYHIYGTNGIQVKTITGEDLLIGTQRPRAAEDIIHLYSPHEK
ncbi:hypothetical protein [Salinimicrobium terrae]|uniref:hypothetical protein n=1 Tax=Salinimicrobium terrae TaxID=470866 RepID=UPI0003F796D0|nr:hypothetical protein [Salinimicrobium terrae]